MSKSTKQQRQTLLRQTAMKTVVFYAVIASLWIYFSDTILAMMITEPHLLTKAQTIKGFLFIVVTALLLYTYLSHCLRKLHTKEDELIRERMQTQQVIQKRFEQLSTLFDSMNTIVYVADLENYNLLYVNRYTSELFGSDWQNIKCFHYLQTGMDTPCEFCTNPQLIENGEAGKPLVWEFLNTRNNRWYNCFDKIIRWTDGRLARLEVAFDITERKELERLKDELLSSMSHEMRTPLTAISGFAELLANDADLSEKHRKHIDIIFREAEKLTELVNRFLDIRRLKIDRSRTGYQHLNVLDLLLDAKASCRGCEHNSISVECPEDLQVYGSHKELKQVFKQLIENACLYSPQGGKIKVHADTSNEQIIISCTDQGIGIPEYALKDIFEPFHRLDTGDARSTGGVGLGLSVAREVISLHGGKLAVKSVEGEGSTFTVTLPVATHNSAKSSG